MKLGPRHWPWLLLACFMLVIASCWSRRRERPERYLWQENANEWQGGCVDLWTKGEMVDAVHCER